MRASRKRDGLDPRVHTEGSEDRSDVVADRLDAQMQLFRDLACRAAVLEESQHLGLAWSQRRMSRPCLLDFVAKLTEHADLPEEVLVS